jgi:hypothetical protein
MAQVNRICKTCGKEYYFCSHCEKTLNSPQWMLMWHDINCKKVFEIASEYAQGRMTKKEANKELKSCNLNVYYTFKESIRNVLDEIMTEEKVDEPQVKEESSLKKNRNSRKKR